MILGFKGKVQYFLRCNWRPATAPTGSRRPATGARKSFKLVS